MFNRKLNIIKKSYLSYIIIIFILFISLYLTQEVSNHEKTDEIHKNEIVYAQQGIIDINRTSIIKAIDEFISDLFYISDTLSIEDDYSDIQNQWEAFCNRKAIYDQIRFIDTNGDEKIRVNYSEDGSYTVEEEKLQNKKDRYYFTKTMGLKKDEVYISKLDLNVEGGIIEKPIKPMIRLSTPYYDESNNIKGIVIINYYAKDILSQIDKISLSNVSTTSLLNSDGYWLFNEEDNGKSWGFMYEERIDEKFQSEFKDEWEYIKNQKEGLLVTEKGVFSFSNILKSDEFKESNKDKSLYLDDEDWYIVSHISENQIEGGAFYRSSFDVLKCIVEHNIGVILILLSLTIFLILINVIKNIEHKKIKYLSEYDIMSKVYNRHTGIYKLNEMHREIIKNKSKLSICFIDINGLKQINDQLGHTAGDELIITVSNTIKRTIRSKDIVCRLGGDEFLIAFEGIGKNESEQIYSRIHSELNKINDTQNRDYIISVSHGIETLKYDCNKSVDDIINIADETMYIEKKIIKRDFNAIR